MIPPAMQSAGTMIHVNAGARMVTVAAIAPAARIARVTASSWVNVFMIDAIACLWREAKESNLLNPRCLPGSLRHFPAAEGILNQSCLYELKPELALHLHALLCGEEGSRTLDNDQTSEASPLSLPRVPPEEGACLSYCQSAYMEAFTIWSIDL